MKYKLLIDDVDGIQRTVEIAKTGGYFDPSKVLWDERVDKALSPADMSKVGGYSRVSDALVYDQTKYDENQAKITQKQTDLADKALKKEQDKLKLKDKSASVKDRLDALVDYLGLDG